MQPEDAEGLRFNLTFRFYALENDLIKPHDGDALESNGLCDEAPPLEDSQSLSHGDGSLHSPLITQQIELPGAADSSSRRRRWHNVLAVGLESDTHNSKDSTGDTESKSFAGQEILPSSRWRREKPTISNLTAYHDQLTCDSSLFPEGLDNEEAEKLADQHTDDDLASGPMYDLQADVRSAVKQTQLLDRLRP